MRTVSIEGRGCVMCGSETYKLIGCFGRYVTLRCRHCGWDVTFNAESDDTVRDALAASEEVEADA